MTARPILLALAMALSTSCMPPSWGANALLHPGRRVTTRQPVDKFEPIEIAGTGGVALKGWLFRTDAVRRGTVVYLHGVAANRGSGVGIAQRLVPRGFDVLAYDSRAHGESGGHQCTYGFYERRDLARGIDELAPGPIVLLGSSMGAAVALQAAAEDARVKAVVAIATISDLRTAAHERAPFFASRGNVEEALQIAEQQANFQVAEVSPVALAPKIRAPVLLIHGAMDVETPVAHSRRVYQALAVPKRLVIVPQAGHNDALNADTWKEIDAWIDQSLGPPAAAP